MSQQADSPWPEKMFLRSRELPGSRCPGCGKLLNVVTTAADSREGTIPTEGQLVVCYCCAALLEFRGGRLVAAAAEWLETLQPIERTIMERVLERPLRILNSTAGSTPLREEPAAEIPRGGAEGGGKVLTQPDLFDVGQRLWPQPAASMPCVPEELGSGPEGETCGSCCFLRRHEGSIFKCGLMRHQWHSERTDIPARWPSCKQWEPKDLPGLWALLPPDWPEETLTSAEGRAIAADWWYEQGDLHKAAQLRCGKFPEAAGE